MVSMSRLDSWSKQSVPDDSCAEWSGQPYPGRRRADSLLERMVATRGLQRGVTRARCFRSSTGTRFAVWPHTGVSGSVAAIGARASRQNERVIEGFEIGHHTADSDGWLTGTTVVVAREGAVGGVDVRGGGPGTRETDLLQPMTLVERVHAVVIGFPAGLEPHQVVPIVPAAVLFDLGRGGVFGNRPTSDFGELALAAASDQPATGCVGAGTGAVCGGIKAGFGYAEKQLATGVSVAAGVVVNAVGSAVDATTGRLWADHMQSLATPTQTDREALADAYAETPAPLATTIGVVLTDAILSKAQASKLAAVAHDGMARAIRPIHSMVDGDTVFCLASDRRPVAEDPMRALFAFNTLLAAAADVFTDACLDAMLAATSRGSWKSYSDLAPSVLGVK
jgi:L-aminopeptidase/D-esterase-like protein